MAKIEDLVDEIRDPQLRERIAEEVKRLKETKTFGLVFEEHIPETVSLYGLPIRPGLIVQNRTTPNDSTEFEVLSVDDGTATLVPRGAAEPESTAETTDLLVVKRFHEPIFPGLAQVGDVRRGPANRPAHIVLNGENFHALQLLIYTYAGQVDCIYIDPPYNTGDKSWKYNNRFVDENDSYRHSKWLSFMEKRLRLAKQLLKQDGVLIVTIDEHEVHHLGLLVDELFPRARTHMVTAVTNPKGTGAYNFSRVDEYVFFICPGEGNQILSVPFAFGMPIEVAKRDRRVVENPDGEGLVRKLALRRDGAESSSRSDRPRQFYALLIDPDTNQIKGIGPELAVNDEYSTDLVDGLKPVYPLDGRGRERVWRYGRTSPSSATPGLTSGG